MNHIIDSDIPKKALKAVTENQTENDISQHYREPIVALQDMDWQPTKHIEFAYYSIYNLYRKYCEGSEIDDWLIIKQCFSAQQNEECKIALFDLMGLATKY